MTAPDFLAPFSARVSLVSREDGFACPTVLVQTLLEDVGRRVMAAGASVLGHVKCSARTDQGGRFHANLTDPRTGATSTADVTGRAAALDIALVVLVYGLERSSIEETVRAAVRAVAVQAHSRWSMEPEVADHRHADHSVTETELS